MKRLKNIYFTGFWLKLHTTNFLFEHRAQLAFMGVANSINGGVGKEYSYSQVLPDKVPSKSIVSTEICT